MPEIDLSTVLAVMAWCGLLPNIYVWGRMAFAPSRNGLLRYFSVAWVGALVALAFSIGFWDVLASFFTYNQWRSFVADLGGKDQINGFRSMLIIVSTYAGLMAAHLLIPTHDRERWPWFVSWIAYPPSACVERFRSFLTARGRRK